jgi:hypothetical protein
MSYSTVRAIENCSGERNIVYKNVDDVDIEVVVVRIGSTLMNYSGSGAMLPGVAIELSFNEGQGGIIHGPTPSFMFFGPDISQANTLPVVWEPTLKDIPSSFNIRSDDGVRIIATFVFDRCQ